MGRVLLSVASFSLAITMLLSGCSSAEESKKEDDSVRSETSEQPVSDVAIDDEVEPAEIILEEMVHGEDIDYSEELISEIFTNSEGKILCPVWQIILDSADVASGSMTHEGKTYYFSDTDAEEMFKANPSKYID